MANIVEFIAGESLIIGDITDDSGGYFGAQYYCYCTVISSNGKCSSKLILSESRKDNTGPFTINILPEITSNWDGKLTIVVTVTNAEPIEESNGVYNPNPAATSVGKSKLYIKAEKFC